MNNEKRTNVRFYVVLMVLITGIILFADRNLLPTIAKPLMHALDISPATLGWIFSCFSIVYVACQIPGGWLLDRFGSRKIVTLSFVGMAIVNILQGFVTFYSGVWVLISFCILRGVIGFLETPGVPAFIRVITTWCPLKEKGLAGSLAGAAQYMAVFVFVPFFAWFASAYNFQELFFVIGILELLIAWLFYKSTPAPAHHRKVNQAELDYIREGGGLPDMDIKKKENEAQKVVQWTDIKAFITNRQTIGIFISQYCFNCLAFFFLSWFPMYLMTERGIDIKATGILVAIPAFGAFVGGLSSGALSDFLMRKTSSLTISRKTPIYIGMLCSFSMFFCNYVDSIYLVVALMTLAYFGKGCSTLGWVILTDVAPKKIIGTAGGIFNAFGNISTIVTPIVIGYIVNYTGSFTWALIFVSAHALLALLSYLVIVGPIKRIEVDPNEEISVSTSEPVKE